MSRIFLPCLGSAVLLAAPFLLPMLFPLAWVAFVPLFWVIERAETPWRAVVFGWLTGFVAHVIGFHWLVYTINIFGGFPYSVSTVLFLIYAASQGLQMALFALLVRVIRFGPWQIFPALIWVAIEFWFPLLFPWHLANSQVSLLSFIQTADLVGPYGASWVIMWFNATLYRLVWPAEEHHTKRWLSLAGSALLAALSVLYGVQRLSTVEDEITRARKLSVAAVQADVGVELKWNPVLAKANLEKHMTLIRQTDAVALVLWPESAVETWLPDGIQTLPAELVPPLKSERSHFIFGARSYHGNFGGSDFKAFNTAFLSDADGRVLARYHKQILLAFGEYLPFARLLSYLPALPFSDGFTPGEGPVVFHLAGGIRVAPLICYEDLMPRLARKFVSDARGNMLVNLTNDAWYGKTVAPWQHAQLARLRAIETRRSLLRVTNTGVTALINAKGELQETLPTFAPAVLRTDVAILNGETYYVRYGDWFAWAMTAATVLLCFLQLTRVFRSG